MAEKKTVSVKVLDMAGEKVSDMRLKASVFGIEPHNQSMFDAVMVEEANSRQATAKTKKRFEVRGGGRKPWRQKGTGRARAGSTRSPIWVGGGTVFGPTGIQNYKISQNKKEHQLALKSALTLKVKEGLRVIDNIEFNEMNTKSFIKFLDAVKVGKKVIVAVQELNENIYASARNIRWVELVTWDNLSVRDLLNADTLVIAKEAIKSVEEALA